MQGATSGLCVVSIAPPSAVRVAVHATLTGGLCAHLVQGIFAQQEILDEAAVARLWVAEQTLQGAVAHVGAQVLLHVDDLSEYQQ